MRVGAMLPLLWAQGTAPGPSPGSSQVQDTAALASLALRRWCSSLTLSSPELSPRPIGLLAVLAGLAALALLALVAQGPRRMLRQFFDVPGHFRLVRDAVRRIQRSTRLIAFLLGSTVLVWSASQLTTYSRVDRMEDLILLRKTRSPNELAIDHGSLAALTPLRDLGGLGDNLILLVAAAVLVFKRSADRWGEAGGPRSGSVQSASMPRWGTLCWGAAWLYALYRLASAIVDTGGLPPGGCLVIEAAIVPLLMLVTDGLLLAWVLVELRDSSLPAVGPSEINLTGALTLLPGAVLACLTAVPGRYAAAATWLLAGHIPKFVAQSGLAVLLQGWGVVVLQAIALPLLGLAGAVAWSRGGAGGTLRGYGRLLRVEGGRMVALAVVAAALCGGLTALSYALVFTFPASTWLLSAADAYAHYVTLPVGLLTVSATMELGERALPLATLAEAGKTVPGGS